MNNNNNNNLNHNHNNDYYYTDGRTDLTLYKAIQSAAGLKALKTAAIER